MKRILGLMGALMLTASLAKAQGPVHKNAIRLGVDYMSLDAPDDLGNRYLVRYARYLANDRVVLEASLGYLKISNNRLLANNFVFYGRPRKRVTADFTASFDFIKNKQHALRLGIGPAVWYREDDNWRYIRYEPSGVTIENEVVNEVNVGMNVVAEYEISVSDRIGIGARLGMTFFETTGISSMAGVNLGYRF